MGGNLLLTTAQEVPQAMTVGAEEGRIWVNHRLPETTAAHANPHPMRELLGNVKEDAHPGGMRASQAESVSVNLEGRANAPGDGEDGGFMEEVSWQLRELHPDRNNGRVMVR